MAMPGSSGIGQIAEKFDIQTNRVQFCRMTDFPLLCLCLMLIRFGCGVVSGATSIGGVMLSMPLLMALMPARDAALLSTIMGIAATPQLSWYYRRSCSLADIRWLIAGCIPGCALGALAIKTAPVQFLQLMICAMLFCFVGLQVRRGRSAWRLPDAWWIGACAGVACGFVSGSVAMAGAPLGVYVLLRGWDPDRARGNMSVFYLFTVGTSFVFQAWAGLYRLDLFELAAVGIAANFLGQMLGFRLGRHVDRELFRRIVTAFLGVAACVLLMKALA